MTLTLTTARQRRTARKDERRFRKLMRQWGKEARRIFDRAVTFGECLPASRNHEVPDAEF